jgi:hypothetical protein
LLVGEPDGDELLEASLAVGDADGRVLRLHEVPCGLGELVEYPVEASLRGDPQHGVAHRMQRTAVEALLHDQTIRRVAWFER